MDELFASVADICNVLSCSTVLLNGVQDDTSEMLVATENKSTSTKIKDKINNMDIVRMMYDKE